MAKKPSTRTKPPVSKKGQSSANVVEILGSIAELMPGILGIMSLFTKRGAITIPRESKDFQFSTTHHPSGE